MGDEKQKISPEEWKARLEANRKLRLQYAEDPSKLTEDEKTRAMVLLQRDQRKVRQQQEKKKQMKNKAASRTAAIVPQSSGGEPSAAPAANQMQEKLRDPIEPEGGYADDDPRKEWAESLRDAIAEKKRRARQERGFKTKAEMGWAPQLKGQKLEEQQTLRERFAKDPDALTAAERARAEVLLARDARKRTKKAQRAEQRAKRAAAANGDVAPTDAQKSLAKKWGFSEKMAAAASDRLKKGLKRGDWECPKCKNKNFARRDKCLKCNEPVPSDHSRWASFGSKEFEHHDEQFWKAKQKEHLERTGVPLDAAADNSTSEEKPASNLWHCKKCGIGNADAVSVCFRCGKHKGSTKFGNSETLAGKIAAASGAESSPSLDKRKQRDMKKAARLGAKLSANSKSISSDSSSSEDDTNAQENASKKQKKTSETDSSDDSSSSESTGSSSSDDDDDDSPQKEIGFTGSGRDTSGDWTCPRCSNLNWNNREKCNRCPQIRGEKPPPTPEELKKQAADKKRRKKQAAKDAAAAATAAAASSKKPMSARGKCVLASKEPEGGGDVENKKYTCGGCGAVVQGAAI